MITFLEGILDEKEPSSVVLNVGGVGYELSVSLNTYEALPPLGDKIRLLTYHHLRENEEKLFGFADKDERECFLKLIDVSGVGPASALLILSSQPLKTLCQIIANEDIKALSSVKGIGKKTAERIIVELKDKIAPLSAKLGSSGKTTSKDAQDAVMALVALGYRQNEAQEAVNRALQKDPDASTDQLVRYVIQNRS
ncbi:Holliday junction branch migration protein RuvA [bacterium]|nr:Holliday junction branch migration protein RuvA [bacterium]